MHLRVERACECHQDNYLSSKLWGSKFEVSKCLCVRFDKSLIRLLLYRVQVHLHQQIGIDINNADVQDFVLKPYYVHTGSEELPLRWFECYPIFSKRLAIMTVHITSESCVTVVWAGNVFVYRGLLRTAGATSLPIYFRLL